MLNKIRKRLAETLKPTKPARKLYPGRNGSWSGLNYALTPINRDMSSDDAGASLAAVVIEDVYAAVTARTKAVGSLAWNIHTIEGKRPNPKTDPVICSSEDIVMTHPLGYAIKSFRVLNGIDLFELWNYCQLVTGKMFIEPVYNGLVYNGLEWYNPVSMQIDDPNGIIVGYRYFGRSKTVYFELNELLYDKYTINLIDENQAQSPIEAAIDSLNISRNMKRALLAYFRNAMKVGAIIAPKEGNVFTDEEIDLIIREMKDGNQGVDNSGKNLFLPLDVDVTFPQQPNLEQNDTVADRISKSIQRVLRVPSFISGDMSETRYKESKDMYDAWFSLVPLPDAKNIADVVNMRLMPLFDPTGSHYFSFDMSYWNERVTQADLDKREAAKIDLDAGAITIEEYRTIVGLDEMDDTDAIRISDRTAQIASNLYREGMLTLNQALAFIGLPSIEGGDIFNINGDSIQVNSENLGQMLGKPSYLPYQSPQTTIQQATELSQNSGVDTPDAPPVTTNPESEAPINVVSALEDDAQELKQWRKFLTNGIKNRPFECRILRGDVEHYVKTELDIDPANPSVVFAKAEKRLSYTKAIQATRIEFELLLEDVIQEARLGNITRTRFSSILRNGIRRWGRQAFIDGLVDGGVTDGMPDAEDEKTIATLIQEQSPYVTNLGDEIYNVGISDAQAKEKPLLWWNKTLRRFYDEGLLSANKNGMLEFAGEDGIESCLTCINLKGQRHRAKAWKNAELRPGVDTDNFGCGGWQCKHILVPTKERARGKLPSPAQIARWVAASKSFPHTHDHTPVDFDEQPYTEDQYHVYYAYEW